MKKPIVDIIVPCSSSQSPKWWGQLISLILLEQEAGNVKINEIRHGTSSLPDAQKNDILYEKRIKRTDTNRNEGVYKFLDGEAEWLMWIDDDTIPAPFMISKLIKLQKPFVSGIYHLKYPPYYPIAYIRNPANNLYIPISNYTYGELIEVDGIGMGCALIHRQIYEDIYNNYELYMRPNGTLLPIHKDDVISGELNIDKPTLIGNNYVIPVIKLDKTQYKFPYYAMEYIRTEDFYFCELAERVGYKPIVDTTIQCQHISSKIIGYEDYWDTNIRVSEENDEQ